MEDLSYEEFWHPSRQAEKRVASEVKKALRGVCLDDGEDLNRLRENIQRSTWSWSADGGSTRDYYATTVERISFTSRTAWEELRDRRTERILIKRTYEIAFDKNLAINFSYDKLFSKKVVPAQVIEACEDGVFAVIMLGKGKTLDQLKEKMERKVHYATVRMGRGLHCSQPFKTEVREMTRISCICDCLEDEDRDGEFVLTVRVSDDDDGEKQFVSVRVGCLVVDA